MLFARIAVVAAALAAAPSAFANDATIADLSRETGVSERHVRVVAGARAYITGNVIDVNGGYRMQ